MNCNPSPEVTCPDTIYDSCVKVTVDVPACLQIQGATCYRQSEVNTQVFNKVCALDASVTSILNSISGTGSNPILVTGLKNCDNSTKTPATINATFQDLYTKICNLKADLSLPLNDAIDTKCLVDPCGDPISTLGELLQAIVNKVCDCCPSGN